MSKAKQGTFEELLALTEKGLQPVATRLRELVLEVHPEACEVVRLGERSATYGLGPKKMSEGYVYVMPHAKWINLGFFKGVDVEDPEGMLEGTGAKLRHVKVRNPSEADAPGLRALVRSAYEERRAALGRL